MNHTIVSFHSIVDISLGFVSFRVIEQLDRALTFGTQFRIGHGSFSLHPFPPVPAYRCTLPGFALPEDFQHFVEVPMMEVCF